jgi:hypothetical protein
MRLRSELPLYSESICVMTENTVNSLIWSHLRHDMFVAGHSESPEPE